MILGLVHVALIWPHYAVGSFDDDASYILAARSLLHGGGLTGRMTNGTVVVSAYPPGFPTLLVPFVWIWPHTFEPMRALSVACYAAIFPLTWWLLVRREVGALVRVLTLVILALCPALATFGSMVMAETPFLVCLLILLLLADEWDRHPSGSWGLGVAVAVLGAATIWLKEASLGAVGGLVLWQLIKKRWWRGGLVAGVSVVLLLPVVIGRLVAGTPVAGSRYSEELGVYYGGGWADRIFHVFPRGLEHMLSTALPATLVPYLTPLPLTKNWSHFWSGLAWQVTVFTVLGAVLWWRRHRDGLVIIAGAYLIETLFWPEVNERRVILVLPVVATWYVLGLVEAGRWLRSWAYPRTFGHRATPELALVGGAVFPLASIAAVAAVILALLPQLPRDYLFAYGQNSSRPAGARYTNMLSRLGMPSDVVETDYLYTTALFTGHRTAESGFLASPGNVCSLPLTLGAMEQDKAAYLLLGAVNKPHLIDNRCLLYEAEVGSWAVRLLRSSHDDSTVFEFVGPGTVHPQLSDLTTVAQMSSSGPVDTEPEPAQGDGDTPESYQVVPVVDGQAELEWNWGSDEPINQVSVGEAWPTGPGPMGPVTVQLLEPGRGWVTVASAPGEVGDGAGAAPYLLSHPPATSASACRLVIESSSPVAVDDAHVLGIP